MSVSSLSKSAQRVQDAVSQQGLDFEVVELATSTRTAIEAAETIGSDVAQIIKSLVFRTKQDRQPILVLASGINRVNEKLIKAQLNQTIEKADADFTREVTGFAIGGIPPIGHAQKMMVFIDEDLLKLDELWAAAGTPHAVFSLKSTDIERLTQGTVIAIN